MSPHLPKDNATWVHSVNHGFGLAVNVPSFNDQARVRYAHLHGHGHSHEYSVLSPNDQARVRCAHLHGHDHGHSHSKPFTVIYSQIPKT
jgi:hypothetical protein